MATRHSLTVPAILKLLKEDNPHFKVYSVLKDGNVTCSVCPGTSIQYRDRYGLQRHLATKSHLLFCKLQALENAYNRYCFDEQAHIQ